VDGVDEVVVVDGDRDVLCLLYRDDVSLSLIASSSRTGMVCVPFPWFIVGESCEMSLSRLVTTLGIRASFQIFVPHSFWRVLLRDCFSRRSGESSNQ
jgi:hypothetical protein